MPGISEKDTGAAASPTNWALLVRSEGAEAAEFIELRQNAGTIWSARGAPYTLGESELRGFADAAVAEACLHREIAEHQAQGFALVHQGRAIPGALDFKLLEDIVHEGTRTAYRQICAEHPEESLSGFALFTDDDGMTIGPAAMSTTSFADIDEDLEYYVTSPPEWPYATDAGLLLAYRIIVVAAYQHHEIPFETEIPGYFDRFFEACIRALERLDADGLFGRGADRENFLLLFGVSDGGPQKAVAKRLNPKTVYRRYAHCFE